MNICVIGAAGKMGRSIIELIDRDINLKLTGAVEQVDSVFIGKKIQDVCRVQNTNIEISNTIFEASKDAKVLIDFSGSSGTASHINAYEKLKKPLVIGSTNLSDNILQTLKKLSDEFPILVSPNMSMGVNILFKLTEIVSKTLKDEFDIEILEAHHRYKKDAPSGTAIKLASIVAETLSRDLSKDAVYTRKGVIDNRKKNEIGIQSIRGGDIVGEHTVMFCGDGERIELTHKASNRDIFARGAIKAALWISDKKKGFYSMFDVLELK